MNVVIYDKPAVEEALALFAQRLKHSFGTPKKISWAFPDGDKDTLPTWSLLTKNGEYIAVAFNPQRQWKSKKKNLHRYPLLLSLQQEKARDGITPTVEVNIPLPMRRNVNGCFAMNSSDGLWLFHRGNKLTVQGNLAIPKTTIHRRFKRVLVSAWDKGLSNEFIPIINSNSSKDKLKSDLTTFATSIDKLKRSWLSKHT